MWRRDVGGDDGFDSRPAPVLVAGSNFMQHSFVGSTLGGPRPRPKPSRSPLQFAKRVLGARGRRRARTVTCIACGASVSRRDAREYDKHGDRWDRENKTFEYLCKPCHADLDHQPRAELESVLVDGGAGIRDREEFLAWYCEYVEERYGPLEE